MFKFVKRFIRPEDFETPQDINNDALETAKRTLARQELELEVKQYDVEVLNVGIDMLKKRIARLQDDAQPTLVVTKGGKR